MRLMFLVLLPFTCNQMVYVLISTRFQLSWFGFCGVNGSGGNGSSSYATFSLSVMYEMKRLTE